MATAVLCRTAARGNEKTFKQNVLDICISRHDEAAEMVKLRLMVTLSDLHAADARHRDECRKSFMARRSVSAAADWGGGDSQPARRQLH